MDCNVAPVNPMSCRSVPHIISFASDAIKSKLQEMRAYTKRQLSQFTEQCIRTVLFQIVPCQRQSKHGAEELFAE